MTAWPATVGALVAALRCHRGWSVRFLARRCAVAPSTVWRVERGQLRPRRILLCALAWGFNPDDPGPIKAALIEAAGELMQPDTDGALARRQRQIDRAMLIGTYALPTEFRVRWEANREGDRMYREALATLNRPGALDDREALERVGALMDQAERLHAAAGGAMTVYIAGKPITVGRG